MFIDGDERRRRERDAMEAQERNVRFFNATSEVRGTLETLLRFLIIDGAPWWSLVVVWFAAVLVLSATGVLVGLAPSVAALPDWYTIMISVLMIIPVVMFRKPIRRVLYLVWRCALYLGIAAVVLFLLAAVIYAIWINLTG